MRRLQCGLRRRERRTLRKSLLDQCIQRLGLVGLPPPRRRPRTLREVLGDAIAVGASGSGPAAEYWLGNATCDAFGCGAAAQPAKLAASAIAAITRVLMASPPLPERCA